MDSEFVRNICGVALCSGLVSPPSQAPRSCRRRRLGTAATSEVERIDGSYDAAPFVASERGQHKNCSPRSSALQLLPPELWGRVALWLRPREFLRLCRCTSTVCFPRERLKLWRFFCYLEGYTRMADDAMERANRSLLLGRCSSTAKQTASRPDVLDWQRCFQLNAMADASLGGSKGVFASVRVHDEELRVPAFNGDITEEHDPTGSEEEAWLFRDSTARPRDLRRALLRMLRATGEMPFRFRELIAGRPGGLLWRTRFHSGGSAANIVVEWPIARSPNGIWRWQLPPHQVVNEDGPPLECRQWDRGKGWVVELVSDGTLGQGTATPSTTSTSKWVHLGLHKSSHSLTIGEFCAELAGHLHHFGVSSGTHVYPADLRSTAEPAEQVRPLWLMRRDLRWTQGEQLLLTEALADPKLPGHWETGVEPREGQPVVLFNRNTTRSKRQLLRNEAWDPQMWDAALLQPEVPQNSPKHLADNDSDKIGVAPVVNPFVRSDEDAPLTKHMPHTRRLLLSSNGVRQFEFHPSRPGVLLAGRKDGVLSVLNYESDTQSHVLEVDTYPILGLSWLQTQPQRAVVGASQSGTICVVGYNDDKPGRMEHTKLEPFPHLSSLSVNCTDDFFMTSGFCIDLALYDLGTGRRLSTFLGLHQNFINILRFAHRSPHLFATASFDHTCKLWDLREPVNADRPRMLFRTDTLNVMCCFSPDDRHILCSGVDTALQQFSLERPDTPEVQTSRFPLPPLHSDTNYRRSLYLADGALIATAATNESLLRLYTSTVPHRHCGHIDFRHMLLRRRQRAVVGPGIDFAVASRPSQVLSQQASALSQRQQREAPREESDGPREEYVQSLRCHPTDPSLLGALLSTCDDPLPESYIAMLRLGA